MERIISQRSVVEGLGATLAVRLAIGEVRCRPCRQAVGSKGVGGPVLAQLRDQSVIRVFEDRRHDEPDAGRMPECFEEHECMHTNGNANPRKLRILVEKQTS